jgi:hypothetical protein
MSSSLQLSRDNIYVRQLSKPIMVYTYTQNSSNGNWDMDTSADFGNFILIDTDDIPAGQHISTVSFHFDTAGVGGTINCCQWANLSDTNQTTPSGLLAAAEHSFGSISAESAVNDVSFSNASSVETTSDTRIGLVLTGTTTTAVKISIQVPKVSSYQQGNVNSSGSEDNKNWTSRFQMETGSPPPPSSSGGKLPPPPIVVRF